MTFLLSNRPPFSTSRTFIAIIFLAKILSIQDNGTHSNTHKTNSALQYAGTLLLFEFIGYAGPP